MRYKKSSKSNKLRCEICANYCKIADDKFGKCNQFKNVNGEMIDIGYGIISAVNVDPIEKKPLARFLPGTMTYSLGGFGCNMGCLHCQNYSISHEYNEFSPSIKMTAETIVENAINHNCKSISWTYNEPTIHLPFNKKVSLLGRQNNLKIIYVSNGYMSNESIDEILTFVDAFNIDLKAMSQEFYKKICKADLDVVLNNIERIYNVGKHIEITNLLINNKNDSVEEITALVKFIAENLSTDVPIHFSRAFPYYKMNDIGPTNVDSLFKAEEIAKDFGMKYVYLGNI
ncbi:MAG: AmmeMemoRadiSam system radical SAM enzyme [Methanobrevibacter sp.]|uniref:AmmeMemoRadiSam system radical SAM enzyme n=1 Tax=Methanobrevibacter sp. TaxID=66852 RepID=UPI0026E094BE|nr:AmmeMemoRadiSam system radical SAM enzyme [Methanobrevibacter sp.]MDO5848594.1 AmmeMemoRadiSam system radical SAM enzyme [Methanobrevibacter sp.]